MRTDLLCEKTVIEGQSWLIRVVDAKELSYKGERIAWHIDMRCSEIVIAGQIPATRMAHGTAIAVIKTAALIRSAKRRERRKKAA